MGTLQRTTGRIIITISAVLITVLIALSGCSTMETAQRVLEVRARATQAAQGKPGDWQTQTGLGPPATYGNSSAQTCREGLIGFDAAPISDDTTWVLYRDHIEADIRFIESYWRAAYPGIWGDGYIAPCAVIEYEPSDPPYVRECGLSGGIPYANAFYCGYTHAIMWDGPTFFHPVYSELGDGAVTFILAHEYGHATQAQSGDYPNTTLGIELQADCYAGATLAWGVNQGRITESDYEEILEIVLLVGDNDLTDAWNTHGTSIQRVRALVQGYRNGIPGCQIDLTELQGLP